MVAAAEEVADAVPVVAVADPEDLEVAVTEAIGVEDSIASAVGEEIVEASGVETVVVAWAEVATAVRHFPRTALEVEPPEVPAVIVKTAVDMAAAEPGEAIIDNKMDIKEKRFISK